MHDIVIRGGTIIDGTGRAAFSGDVAIDGGRVTAIGGKAGPARREIAADGLLVTPGWVDVHTHYDGQATWDPILAPSSWHGVTTILFGNCGVGFAPVRPYHRDALIDLMEGVEDIPGPVLAEGLKWDWESFPDFLDALERMPRTIDVAAQVPHHPLRVYVMGDRAIRREPATAEDIAEMRRLTEEAEVAGRPVGVILGIATSFNPFAVRERYKPFQALPLSERLCRLRDPAVRRAILDDRPSPALLSRFGPLVQFAAGQWDRMYVMGDPPDYEPRAETSVAAIAAREGRSPDEGAYDYLTGDAGHFLFFPVTRYARDDHEPIREMLVGPGTLLGLGVGGAHVAMIVDASAPTYLLTHWGRDRKRGPGLPREYMVKRQTSETADFFGFHDRGRLLPGKRADINLIDFDRLRLHTPEVVNDLPAGGKRLVQGAEGYEATLVAGTPVFERGEHTGAKPGRLVRRGP